MTRASTWSNPDGLVVGFGPNFPERIAAAVTTQKGTDTKVAKCSMTYQSTTGSSGAKVDIPAGSIVKNVYVKITTTFVGGTSISVGDSDVDGWVLAASWTTPSAGAVIQADGVYAQGDAATNQAMPKEYAAAGSIYFTVTGTYTAGAADLFVEYV